MIVGSLNDESVREKYSLIVSDPPWVYSDKSLHRGGAERHYKTMTQKEICDLPVQSIAQKDAVLLLWATFPNIKMALAAIVAWGFEYKGGG